jgi:hypothetical protein
LLNWEREILLLHCERERGRLQKWEKKRLLEQNRKECFGVSCKVLMLVLYIDHLKHNLKLSMRWQNVGPMASQKQDDFKNKVHLLSVE